MADKVKSLPDVVQDRLLEPKEALEYWRAKKRMLPSFDFAEVWQEEHVTGFAMAKILRQDVLKVIYEGLDEAIAKGQTLAQFRKSVTPKLEAAGFWGKREVTDPRTGEIAKVDVPRRLALVYDTNLRMAYSAGRWARIQANVDVLPHLVYRTMGDSRVRPLHRSWEGTSLPVAHEWWATHYPPNDYGCRCRAYATDEAGLGVLRKAAPLREDAPPVEWMDWQDPATGRTARVPAGIGPGFAYNPGVASQRHQALVNVIGHKVADAPVSLGAATAADILADQHAATVLDSGFADWAATAASSPTGLPGVAGFITPAEVKALASRGEAVENLILDVHASRLAKTEIDWPSLPAQLRTRRATLWDRKSKRLMYVLDVPHRSDDVLVAVPHTASRVSAAGDGFDAFHQLPLAELREVVADYKLEIISGALESP